MNSLKLNNKVRHNIITKTTSLALASILITSMFVGLIPIVVMPAAAANTYLSVSQTQLGSDNAIQITVSDSSLTTAPTVTLSWGTNTQQDLTANFARTPLGDWILFIANSTAGGFASGLDSAPTIVNSTISNELSAIGDGDKTLIETIGIVVSGAGEDEATLTYGERSETVTLSVEETAVSAATPDRTEAPPSAEVHVTLTDATENIDPTVKDTMTYTVATTVNIAAQAAPTTISMTETDVNTGIFKGTISTTGISTAPSHGDLLQVTITDDDDSDDTGLVSVNIVASDGVLSTTGSLTYSDKVTVSLKDDDRNLDSETAETLSGTDPLFAVKANATLGTGLYNVSDLSLKETDKNTGIFEGTIAVNIGNVTALAIGTNNSKAVTYNVTAGDSLSIALTYTDPVQVTSNHYSEGTITLGLTLATIEYDQSSYLPNTNGIPAIITLTEPDANDDATAIELLTVTNATTRGLLIHSSGTTVGKLNFTETKGTSTQVIEVTDDVQFIETEIDSGVFTLRVDLQTGMNGTRASGWEINATYYDSFKEKYVSATADIGGTLATIALDRTALPTLPGSAITVKVTLTDADANTNSGAEDTSTISLYAKNATNQDVNFNTTTTSLSITVTETEVDSSEFTGSFTYTIVSATGVVNVAPGDGRTWYLVDVGGDSVEGSHMIGGTFNATYNEPLATGSHIDAIGTVTPNTGTLSVTPSGVNLNGTVVFTYTDEDLNDNTATKDTVVIQIRNATLNQATSTLTLTETDVNTGIFNGSKRAGDQSPIDSPSFRAGDVIKASYTDLATSNSYYATGFTTAALTGQSTVASNDAALTLDATSYGPYSTVKVTVTDPDLILDTVGSVSLNLVKTSAEECRTNTILKELNNPKKLSDGAFQFSIVLSPTSAGTCASGAGIKTALVDTLTVYYVDAMNAAGTAGVVLTTTASIASVTGTVATTPSAVLVGEFLTITVNDLDQNKDGDIIESVNVVVTTNTWALGQNVTLPETSANSASFEAKVKIVAGIPATTNEVRGTVGDTITVSYKDRSNSTGEVSNVVVTGLVGITLPPLERVPAGTPAIVDINGIAVTPTEGNAVAVESQVCNDDSVAHAFTYIVQVKNAIGEVSSISWVSGNLPVAEAGSTSCSMAAASWTPDSAGAYTIDTFVLDSIASGIALSPVSTLTVTVV